MLAVRGDLADSLSEIASRKGHTLYGMVNEALSAFVAVEDSGLTTREVLEAHRMLVGAREAGFLMCPANLWYEAVDLAYQMDGGLLSERWFEAGARCAKLLLIRGVEDPLVEFEREMRGLTSNASDLSIKKATEGENLIRWMSRRFSKSFTSLLSLFLEGAFTTFGYRLVQKDVAKGALQLRFVPKAAPPVLEPNLP